MGLEAATIFVFWAALFTGLTLKGHFVKDENSTENRLDQKWKAVHSDRYNVRDVTTDNTPNLKVVRERLLHAGLRRRSDLQKFLLLQRICYSMPLFFIIGFTLFFRVEFKTALLLGGALGIAFFGVPRLWIMHLTVSRRKEIKKFLPDTLDLFVIALDAGLSFDSALVRVAEEQRRVSTHISREFLFANQQILVGKTREEALRAMAHRAGVDELDALVRAVIQSNRLGTSLVKTLRVQADTLRKKRRQEVHAKIMKAPVKLIFPLMFCILPILFVVILSPSVINMIRTLTKAGF